MNCLVTGGGGFLGAAIAERLLADGYQVTVLGRRNYPALSPEIRQVRADLKDRSAIFDALKGMNAVFHSAAVPGVWGPYSEYYKTNVEGTQNIIDACLAHHVPRLIFTSSPSVIYDMKDQSGVDESVAFPNDYLCHYAKTKAMAEQLVSSADGRNGLRTISIRPHLIWGPGDPHLVPRLIEKAQSGKLVQVGAGKNKVDMVYIDNAVECHVLAERALRNVPDKVGGKAYFVSDDRPVELWKWINDLLNALHLPKVEKSISFRTAYVLGLVAEGIYGFLKSNNEPPITRFVAGQLATDHYYDIRGASNDLGYSPIVTPDEGFNRLINYFNKFLATK
jgi:2-alkyl-3-oxoalkanoate reductase